MKKFFPCINIRDISLLGLLMAITALLSIFCTFRIGTVVKIPLKFISVFVTAVMFGPLWGGVCGAVGDILNCILAPVGPFVPQITLLEFLTGFIFGLFFIKYPSSKPGYTLRILLCSLVHLFMAMVVHTAIYTFWLKWFPGFWEAFIVRTPAAFINFLLQFFVLTALYPTINRLKGERGL